MIRWSRYVLLLLLGINSILLSAQHQNRIWAFGDSAGLDFKTEPPTTFVTNMSSFEGCASIADAQGNLLFYTNGEKIWDRNHNIMPNGHDLKGHYSSSQEALIVPWPNSCTKYFVFSMEDDFTDGGLHYSVVDMLLNDGFGDVMSSSKNILLVDSTTEQVTAVLHDNGSDVWIVTHLRETNQYLSFLLTSDGLSVIPVVSSIGTIILEDIHAVTGLLKHSNDRTKIVMTNYIGGFCEMFNFNASTGEITDVVDITPLLPTRMYYGVEFSENDSILYLQTKSSDPDSNKYQFVYQVQLKASPIQVTTLYTAVLQSSRESIGALQMAPNGKIYAANLYWQFLDVIEFPNKIGLDCEYVNDGIILSPEASSAWGLPNPAPYSFCLPLTLGTDINLCEGGQVTLIAERKGENCMQSFVWDNGSLDSIRVIEEPGLYWIEVTSQCETVYRDTINIGIDSLAVTKNVNICQGDSYEGYSETGIYLDTILINSECEQIRTLHLFVNPISTDSIYVNICEGDTLDGYFQAGIYIDTFKNYLGCDSLRILTLNVQDCPPIIYYSLNSCESVMSNGTHMDYSEFTPVFPTSLDCAEVSAEEISRANSADNKHSCTIGLYNTPAMCVNIHNSCVYDPDNAASVLIEFTIAPSEDSIIRLSLFEFYEKSPVIYSWINGSSGLNNRARNYGIRIFKNGIEIFQQSGIETSSNWTLQSFNFSGNDNFIVDEVSKFRIELLGYCPTGNSSDVSVWDLDEFKIYASCIPLTKQLAGIEGYIKKRNGRPVANVLVELGKNISLDDAISVRTDESGYYRFDSLMIGKTYFIKASKTDDKFNGVNALDLVRIQKHLLGTHPFTWLDQEIAADVDQNLLISAIDNVELMKLLLGINSDFPGNSSWQIGVKPYELSGPPFSTLEMVSAVEIQDTTNIQINFLGIKIGDVTD